MQNLLRQNIKNYDGDTITVNLDCNTPLFVIKCQLE